jgi:hypothetical protein
VLHLDLNDRSLLTFGLEGSLDQLADDHDALSFLQALRCVLGDSSPCRAAEEPVVDVLPLAVVLATVVDRDGQNFPLMCFFRSALLR